MRSLTMKEILRAGSFDSLEATITRDTNRRCANWSVQLDQVVIERIELRTEISDENVAKAVAGAQAETNRLMEAARAASTRDTLRIIAEGYRIARAMGMTGRDIHQEVLRRTLEEIAKDPATKLVFTPELRELLESVQR